MFHYRESRSVEIDLLIEQVESMDAVEIKSGATVSKDFFKNLERFSDRLHKAPPGKSLRINIVFTGEFF